MALFYRTSTWSVGYFRALSSYLLRQKKSIPSRLIHINREVQRIGEITVFYRREEQPDGSFRVSEVREGFSVTPGSSLGKLIQAFIAQGGNPLDISGFMYPDRTQIVDGVRQEVYPSGGVVAPQSVNANNPVDESDDTGYGGYRGGYVNLSGYHPKRLGGRTDRASWDDASVVNTMNTIRRPFAQEMHNLQILAWKVIKLCDLREQLIRERDEILVQAFGGTLDVLGEEFDDDRFVRSHLVQNLIQDMNATLFDTFPDGTVVNYQGRGDIGLLEFCFYDEDSERRHPL